MKRKRRKFWMSGRKIRKEKEDEKMLKLYKEKEKMKKWKRKGMLNGEKLLKCHNQQTGLCNFVKS